MTTFKEVSEERYDEMLGCLPPVAWVGKGFLVGEPWDHNEAGQPRFAPFISLNGKFYEGDHPITVTIEEPMRGSLGERALHASMSDASSASLTMRGGGIALDLWNALRSKASVWAS